MIPVKSLCGAVARMAAARGRFRNAENFRDGYNGHYAIHGTTEVRRLGRPASAGCVRLHPDNARTLFNLVKDRGPEALQVVVEG